MSLLYEDYAILEPVVINTFSNPFDPIEKGRTTITWLEPGKIQVKMPKAGSTGTWYAGPGVLLATLGGEGGTIPGNIVRATWNMTFRFLKEERAIEGISSTFLFWGQEYVYAFYFGVVKWPLFEIYLNAADNHLYIRFNGVYKNDGAWAHPTYPFHEYEVDLGSIENFYKWTNLTLWIDCQQKAFTKIMIGNKAIPFPEGYNVIKPSLYADTILNGLMAGDLHNWACTNLTIEVKGIQIWSEYYTPPSPEAWPWWLLLLGAIDLVTVGRSLTVKETR